MLPNPAITSIKSTVTASVTTLPTVEAESGTLGSAFGVNVLASATNITLSPTGASF